MNNELTNLSVITAWQVFWWQKHRGSYQHWPTPASVKISLELRHSDRVVVAYLIE